MTRINHNDPFPYGDDSSLTGLSPSTDTHAIDETPTEDLAITDDRTTKGYVGLSVGRGRLSAALLGVFVMMGVMLARAGYVQVVQADYYRDKAEGNRSRIEYVPSERGIIYDRNGIPMVRNVPSFRLVVTPSGLPKDETDRRRVIARIADILGTQPIEIEEAMRNAPGYPDSPAVLAEDLSHEQTVLLTIESASWPAVSVENGMRRNYLFTDEAGSLSHLIGFRGAVTEQDLETDAGTGYLPTDRIGKTGIERWYEDVLRGVYGRRRIEIDASGREKTVIAEERGEDGRGIVTTIDVELQTAAERILEEQLSRSGLRRGSVIVMRPDTGEVLAMVNEPDFDNNLFARGISAEEFAALNDDPDHPLFPRAIAAALPSGSVFKPVVAAAAIDEDIVTPSTRFLSTGGLTINGAWYFPDWKAGGHGWTNMAKAIADSVNTYFYIIGGGYEDQQGLGVERIKKYAQRFGFGGPLGVDLPGETGGFIPDIAWKEAVKGESWYIGDTYHLAIGQGDLLVTPLQIATMTAVFANGGDLVRPRMVNAITANDGTRQPVPAETILEHVVSSDAIDAVRAGMRLAVTDGSARSLSLLPVKVAGKTGTAQWSSTKDNHAWFTSFAPYDDPEIVVTVSIEEGGEGSVVAAPVARDIYSWYFSR